MRAYEIQREYLAIQESMGKLLDAAPAHIRPKLKELSTQLLRVKRSWVGAVDEIDSENF